MNLPGSFLLLTFCMVLGPLQIVADEADYEEEIVLRLVMEEDAQVDSEKKTTPGVFLWSNKVQEYFLIQNLEMCKIY